MSAPRLEIDLTKIGRNARGVRLAVGEQDVDPLGLGAPPGTCVVGASSDHLVLTSADRFPIGATLRFAPSYSALLRAMTSPYVDKQLVTSPEGVILRTPG